MDLTPQLESFNHISGLSYKLDVKMNIPSNTDYQLIDKGTDSKTRLIHAKLKSGTESGEVFRSITFERNPDDVDLKVVAINLNGDPEEEFEILFPN